MKKYSINPDDLTYLREARGLVNTKRVEMSLINLAIEAYILGVVLPKLGIDPSKKVKVDYKLDEGTLEVKEEGEEEVPPPDEPKAV